METNFGYERAINPGGKRRVGKKFGRKFRASDVKVMFIIITCIRTIIVESVDSISRDERDVPLTQYITNA